MALPAPLSGSIEGSFAYHTIRDRLPVILTKVIDHLCREKLSISHKYGEVSSIDIKEIVGRLSQLNNHMRTSKPIVDIGREIIRTQNRDDSEIWEMALLSFKNKNGEYPRWFTASWLFVECYMYKRIHDIFLMSKSLKLYDYFFQQKVQAFYGSLDNVKQLCTHICKTLSAFPPKDMTSSKIITQQLLHVSLWGNQCDLSISYGEDRIQQESPLEMLEQLRQNIILCEEEFFWEYLVKIPKKERHFGLILDNAGFELFADLCFLTILVECGYMQRCYLYTKIIPWFVSDTMLTDFNWLLHALNAERDDCSELSKKWLNYIENGVWVIKENKYWTTHLDFSSMETVDPQLYQELKTMALLIIKGDLNYRKLVGDLDWSTDTPMRTALREFLPTSMLALRTVKGGPVVGLNEEAEEVKQAKAKNNWNISGEYGMIQFISL